MFLSLKCTWINNLKHFNNLPLAKYAVAKRDALGAKKEPCYSVLVNDGHLF